MPDTPETAGVPGDVAALRAENGRLREANERLRMLLEDKDAQIAELKTRNAELETRVARLERLISRNAGFSELGLRLDAGWVRLVLPAGVSDGVDDEVEVGLIESGDGVTQDDR